MGFARRSERAWRRKGDRPLSCIFFIPPNLPVFLDDLCITPKPCKSETLSFHRLHLLLQASSAHMGAETAQICANAPSVVSLLYLPCKSAETARICRHPARGLLSPQFLLSPASISIAKGFVHSRVPVGSITSTSNKAPFLLSPEWS